MPAAARIRAIIQPTMIPAIASWLIVACEGVEIAEGWGALDGVADVVDRVWVGEVPLLA